MSLRRVKPVRVEVRGVTLAFGDNPVLRDIRLTVEPGEFFALLGPSGCGKSTLLRLIAGFNRAQHGTVCIDGEDIGAVPPWERNVGMVFQSYALWPHMTVAENVAFGLEERRLPRAQVRARTAEALALVGLAELGARRPGQLSGGQQQRVALARTLAVEPRVLLLDEPLSNLDAKLRHHMRRELLAMQRKLGITTIFVTHDQEEALTTADRIAVMDQGLVQQVGAPRELYDAPANRFVAEFVGTLNLVPASEPAFAPLASGAEPGAQIALRPHSLLIAQRPTDAARHWISCEVVEREFLGEFIRYRLRVGDRELIADQPHALGNPGFAPGASASLGIERSQVRLLRA